MTREEKILSFKSSCPSEWLNRLSFDEPMSKHTTFLLGGKADIFIEAQSVEEVRFFVQLAKKVELPYQVLGLGSNLIISDEGIRGLVFAFNEHFSQISECSFEDLPQSLQYTEKQAFFVAEAGASLKSCSFYALDKELQGLSFACGIPGSVGGAVYMNAGAYGGEMKQVVLGVEALLEDGSIRLFDAKDLAFSYRYSLFKDLGKVIILRVYFAMDKGDKATIQAEMQDFTQKREASQPLELASAGSMFKRPEGYFAGKLISDAGLKGYRKGDVGVSDKHAGFVVHYGGGSTTELVAFVKEIQAKVKEQFNVELEPEVRFIGEGEKPWN